MNVLANPVGTNRTVLPLPHVQQTAMAMRDCSMRLRKLLMMNNILWLAMYLNFAGEVAYGFSLLPNTLDRFLGGAWIMFTVYISLAGIMGLIIGDD